MTVTAGENSSTGPASIFSRLPQWFAIFAGVVYAAGFLIVFCFYNYMGMRGAIVEGLRAKYIYVGLLCIQFPVSLGVTFFTPLFTLRPALPSSTIGQPQQQLTRRQILEAWAMSGFSGVMLLFFYLLMTFAPPGYFAAHNAGIAIFFSTSVVGALVNAWQRGMLLRSSPGRLKAAADRRSLEMRYALILALTVELVVVFWELGGELWEICREGGYVYLLLLLLIAVSIWRLRGRYVSHAGTGLYSAYANSGLTLCATFFYLSAVSFAYRIYPYIPVAKGGGDYTAEPLCSLRFDSRYAGNLPTSLVDSIDPSSLVTKPVIILEETQLEIYVAEVSAVSTPRTWRKPGVSNKPHITTIARAAIVSTECTRP